MTVIDRLRSVLPPAGEPSAGGRPWGPGWRRSGAIGVLTGLLSCATVVVPVWFAWDADPARGSSGGTAVQVGASLWLLLGGGQLDAGGVTVALTPLLALGVLVWVARTGAREAIMQVSTEGEYWGGLVPRPLAAAIGAWWSGYGALVALAWVVAAQGPFTPRPLGMLLPAVVLPLFAVWLAVAPVGRDDPEVLGPRLAPGLPEGLLRGAGPGLAGAAMLVALGSLVVLAAVVLSWPQVRAVDAEVGATSAGALLLVAAQVASLPNLALWALSFLAGPGFSVVDGASVSWGGAESALLPMVPVLAAMPQPGPFPVVVGVLAAAAVVACGGWVGQRALRSVARLSRLRTKLVVATVACATAAVVVGLLDAVGGGSVGQFRLSSVGAPAVRLAAAVFAELLAGAVLAVLRDAWRLRR